MTRPLAEAPVSAPQQAVSGLKEAAINLSPPIPIGFNGGSTEAGVKKATIVPVFTSLGELKVTSLQTSNVGGTVNTKVYAGTNKTCENSCGGSCEKTCPSTC